MSRLPVTTALPRPLWRTDRGAVAVVVAVAMAALLLVGAVVVDIGAALVSRHHAQTVADAAALAGARQLGQPGAGSRTVHGGSRGVLVGAAAPALDDRGNDVCCSPSPG